MSNPSIDKKAELLADPQVERVANMLRAMRRQATDDEQHSLCDALVHVLALATRTPPPSVGEEVVDQVSEIIHDFLDERFPDGAMPGGVQLFADDHLDAEFKHEGGCDALAERIVAALASRSDSAVVEALRYSLDDWQALVRIIGTSIKDNDGPDRVRWEGQWHEGPLATAYLKTLRAIEEMAKRNVEALAAFQAKGDA